MTAILRNLLPTRTVQMIQSIMLVGRKNGSIWTTLTYELLPSIPSYFTQDKKINTEIGNRVRTSGNKGHKSLNKQRLLWMFREKVANLRKEKRKKVDYLLMFWFTVTFGDRLAILSCVSVAYKMYFFQDSELSGSLVTFKNFRRFSRSIRTFRKLKDFIKF